MYFVQDSKTGIVKDAVVYGLEKSIKVSKYPMAVETDSLSSSPVKTTARLGSCPTGEGHDNFLKGIIVQFDLRFTNKAWVEAERYNWFDIVSSQSTMHRITKFDLDTAYNEYTDEAIINRMKELVEEYNSTNKTPEQYLRILYSNPAGFMLTAGMTTNYQQLKTIYQQRKTHRLPEWREFCEWIETLPQFKELVLQGKKKEEE